MIKNIKNLFIILVVALLSSCRALTYSTIVSHSIKDYKYLFFPISAGAYYGTQGYGYAYGGSSVLGYTASDKTARPNELITGNLMSNGFRRLDELKNHLMDETLIVTFGESGRYGRGFGYTIEVTIQFISAESNDLVCSCTAEGQGSTEADDVIMAITRCLESLGIYSPTKKRSRIAAKG